MENKTTFSIDLPTCFVTCVFCFVAIIITNMGDGTVYYNLTLIPFTKWFESSENLVNLLESRGLQIYDRNKAIQYLDNIGYYRLSAYMYPLLKMPKTAHLYKEGSSFKKVMMLYRFDKKLRLLMFNEIEKIEIAIPK